MERPNESGAEIEPEAKAWGLLTAPAVVVVENAIGGDECGTAEVEYPADDERIPSGILAVETEGVTPVGVAVPV